MKACICCGAIKPLDQFYAHKAMADLHLNKCKECCKAYAAKRHASDVEASRKYDRKRRQTEQGQLAKRALRERHKDKYAARKQVELAVAQGQIQRLPCEICGEVKSHAHHVSYDAPLLVTWLCHGHHMQTHAETNQYIKGTP